MSKASTICLFNSNTTWGGGEKWVQETAKKFFDNSQGMVVCVNKSSLLFENLNHKGLQLVPVTLGNLSFINPLKILYLFLIFRKYKVNTIILGLSQDLKAAGLAAKLAGVQQILYRRGLAYPKRNSRLIRFYFRHIVTKVIANSEEVKRSMLANNHTPILASDMHVIYNGITLADIPLKNSSNQNNTTVILGNAGRFIDGKGYNYLVELAVHLKAAKLNFMIKLAGTGKLQHQIEEYAKRMEVDDCIIFEGFIVDISNFYEGIDLFIFPSESEGCSNAVLEAMAFSKPVVAFNISSMPEMVDDGINGFLVPFECVQTMAKKTALLINNPDLRDAMGKAAREKITAKFDFDTNHRLLEALFEN